MKAKLVHSQISKESSQEKGRDQAKREGIMAGVKMYLSFMGLGGAELECFSV